MNLTHLGWTPFFESYFEPFQSNSYVPARVARSNRSQYLIFCEQGEFSAELSGKFQHQTKVKSDFPVVGDWVVAFLRVSGGKATIHGILPRRSSFSRKVAGSVTEEQVVVANVDTVFIVMGLDRDFNLRRLERYLTLAWDNGTSPVIILNKADLCSALADYRQEVESIAFGVPVLPVSALRDQGIDELNRFLVPGHTVAFLGSSGVGKSSLINRILGEERQFVNSVRATDGRGRHTTSHRELIFTPGGGMIIDNPGMRELQLWTDEESLANIFEDIEQLAAQCRFRNCQHENEPGCAVVAAISTGSLHLNRLANYRKMKKEIQYLATRQDQRARLVEKEKWKKIAIFARKKIQHKRT